MTDHLIRIKSWIIFRSNCHLQVSDGLSLIFDIQLVDHEVLPWSKINLAKIQIWHWGEDIFIGHFQSCSRHILNVGDGAYQIMTFIFYNICAEQLHSLDLSPVATVKQTQNGAHSASAHCRSPNAKAVEQRKCWADTWHEASAASKSGRCCCMCMPACFSSSTILGLIQENFGLNVWCNFGTHHEFFKNEIKKPSCFVVLTFEWINKLQTTPNLRPCDVWVKWKWLTK